MAGRPLINTKNLLPMLPTGKPSHEGVSEYGWEIIEEGATQ
jgi:hypothetical protein